MLICTCDPEQKSCSTAGFISCGLTSYLLPVFRLTGFVHRSEACCHWSLNAMHIVHSFPWVVLIVVMCVMLHYHILYIYMCMYCMRFNCWVFVLSLLYSHSASCICLHIARSCFKAVTGKRWGEPSTVGLGVSEVLIKYSIQSIVWFFFFLNVFFVLMLQVARSAAVILHT